MLRIKKAKVPKLRKVHKAAPKSLEKVLARALHRKEKKRFQTAGEFADAVDEFRKELPKPFDAPALVQYLTQTLA